MLSSRRCEVRNINHSPKKSSRIPSLCGRRSRHATPFEKLILSVGIADLCEGVAPILICKARANDEEAKRLYREFELNYGKRECEIERYFNQCFFFNWLDYMIFQNDSKREFVL